MTARAAPQETQDLLDLLAREARLMSAIRPGRYDGFIFSSEKEPLYISPAFKSSVDAPAVAALHQEQLARLLRDSAVGNFSTHYPTTHGKKLFVASIVIDFEKHKKTKRAGHVTLEMDILGTLDHEAAHMLIPEAQDTRLSQHLRESIAESYAALRHIQRFGGHTGYLCQQRKLAARDLLGGNMNYYCLPVFDHVEKLAQKEDLHALNPQQTLDLARKIGRTYHYDEAQLEHLRARYQSVNALLESFKKFGKAELARACEALLDVMSLDEDAFRAGAHYLGTYATGLPRLAEKCPGLKEKLDWMQARIDGGFVMDAAEALDAQRAAERTTRRWPAWLQPHAPGKKVSQAAFSRYNGQNRHPDPQGGKTMLKSLTTIFTDALQQWRDQRAISRVIAAFENDPTPAQAGRTAQQLTDHPKLDETGYARLLNAALRTDDPAVLSPILGMRKDPNHTFNWEEPVIGRVIIAHSEHILYRALKDGRTCIAADLIADPRVRVDVSGWQDTAMAGSKPGLWVHNKINLPSPLNVARAQSLRDLAEAIMKKMKAPTHIIKPAT